MACRYTYQGNTYEAWEFEDVLKAMPPSEASSFMPGVNPIPEAPFIRSTDAVLNLALKRAIIMAVQGDYKKVAFINGQQSADRYDLSTQINYIQWNPNYADGRLITLEDKGGKEIGISVEADGTVYDSSVPGAEGQKLDAVIGKELADKVLAKASGDMRGLDLKVGGKGMKTFYNSIVPNAIKGLLKKLGGGKLITVSMSHDPNVALSMWESEDGESDGSKAPIDQYDQLGFEVTPAMIEKVNAGVPLFSKRDTQAAEAAGFDADTVYYHGTTAKDFKSFRPGNGGVDELGAGIYFTSNPMYAEAWSGRLDMGGRIIPAYLKTGDYFDKSKPVDYVALAKRIKANNPATDAERQAKVIRQRSVQTWTPEESKIINDTSMDLWRTWLLESDSTLASQIKQASDINPWLERAGYLGAKNENSQIPGQVVVFDAKNIRSPWAKFNPKKADSANILHSKRDQTETPEFEKWFGDSKVVDAQGKPLVVYHGTGFSISEFGSNRGMIYFARDPETAYGYADSVATDQNDMGNYEDDFGRNSEDGGASIYPVYLSVQNPFDTDNPAHVAMLPKSAAARIGNGQYTEIEQYAPEIKAAGFDGAYVREQGMEKAEDCDVAVFNPAQIKSAIGNNGNFDGADPDIRHSTRDIIGNTNRQYTPDQLRAFANVGFETEVPSLKEKIQALWKDAGKKLAQGIFDQFRPIKDIDTTAYGLMRLAKGASGAFETLLRGGKLKLSDGVYDFDETEKGGVVDKLLIPMNGEHHDFLRWVAANRAERLIGEDKEHLFSQTDIDAIKTLQDGQLVFDYTLKNGPNQGQVTRNREDMYKDSLVTFNEFNTNVLDLAEESGLIDGAARQFWEHEFYVPFYRVSEEDGFVGAKIKGGAVRQQAFKKLKGGKDALNPDLLDNTLMNWAHLLDASAKNRAAKATLEAAENVGVALSTDEETARQIGKSTGNKNGVVWFMDDGKEHYYLVDDPFVLQAITSLEYAGMRNPVMTGMGVMKHMLTVGVTASPFFKVRNLIRDSVQVIGTGNISYNPLKNVAEGWKLTNPENDLYFRLLAGGGTIHFGTMLEGSEAKRVQALVESGVADSTILNSEHKVKAFYRKFIEPGVTAYNELGNRGEAVNRASLYDQLVKQGMSHADASLQARDLMDFSMQGSFTSIRFLTQIVPFLNARLQGLNKLGRATKENPRRMAYVAGAVTMASLGLLAAFGDDDDWKKRELWDRQGNWWFKFGGVAFRIPKPFEIGAVGTLAEHMAEYLFTKEMTGARFNEAVLKLLGDNLSMNPIPQMVKPMLDIYANKDSFNGRPIESMSMERLRPEYRFTGNTTMAARAASTGANAVAGLVGKEALSPVQIDHLIKGYFGWLGTFISGSFDKPARLLTNQPSRPAADLWKLATGGMVSQLNDSQSKYVSQVYEQAKAIEQAQGTWRALLKEGKTEEAKEFRADNIDKLKNYKSVEAIKGALSKINQQIRMIERSDADGQTKREKIRKLNEQKDKFARRLEA